MSRPPRVLRWLLERLLPRTERRHLLGEMDDLYARRARRDGRFRASLWYLRSSPGFALRFMSGRAGSTLAGAFDSIRGSAGDFRVSWRVLRRRPGYTLATVLTLGIGVGGAATVYAAANWVLLRPVPGVTAPDELWTIKLEVDEPLSPAFPVSQPDLESLRVRVPALLSLEAAVELDVHARTGPESSARRLVAQAVTPGYFELLGLAAVRGRVVAGDDEGLAGVVAVSHRFARATWSAPAAALGSDLEINGRPFTIVGILAPGFHGAELPGSADLWLPAAALPSVRPDLAEDVLGRRTAGIWTDLVGRLRPGATPDTLTAQASRVIQEILDEHAWETALAGPRFLLRGYPGLGPAPRHRPAIERTLGLLALVSGLLLVLAMANLTNLALAHGATRRSALTVRAALGAGRLRMARTMAVEHGLLGLLGALVGVLVAAVGVRGFRDAKLATDGGSLAGLEIDPRVGLFILGAALATAWATALVPAAQAFGRDLLADLRGRGADRRTHRLQSALVVAQVAVSVTLLVSAGLLTRTVLGLRAVSLGFEPEGAIRFALDPRVQGYGEDEIDALVRDASRSLLDDPRVRTAGFASPAPVRTSYLTFALRPPGADEDESLALGAQFEVTPGLLEAMGTRLIAGRTFVEADLRAPGEDRAGAIPAVLSRSMVEGALPGTDPASVVGRVLNQANERYPPIQVVGVIEDLRLVSLSTESPALAFLPWGDGFQRGEIVAWVRAEGDPGLVPGAVAPALAAAAPGLPVYDLRTGRAQVDRLIVEERLITRLALALGCVGLLLAGVGVHGVLGYAVTQRRREIGVRAALGASRRGIVARVVGRALGLTALGLLLGGVASSLLAGVLESRLFGVEPLDPLTWLIGAAALLATAWVAAWGPARRATRIPPSEALVAE